MQVEAQPRELCTAATHTAIARIHIEIIEHNRTIRAGVFAEQPDAYQPALDCLMHALGIYEARLGPKHLESVRVCFALGEVFLQQQEHAQAMEFFRRAVATLTSDGLEGLDDEQDKEAAQGMEAEAGERTALCQAVLAPPEAVLRQLDGRPTIVITAHAADDGASTSPPSPPPGAESVAGTSDNAGSAPDASDDAESASDAGEDATDEISSDKLSARSTASSGSSSAGSIGSGPHPSRPPISNEPVVVDCDGVFRFVDLHNGWPRFESSEGKQLLHTSEGVWCIKQPESESQTTTSEDQSEPPAQQPQQKLSVLATDGLLPEGTCTWRVDHCVAATAEDAAAAADGKQQPATDSGSDADGLEQHTHTQTLQVKLTIPADVTQLNVGTKVVVQRPLSRYNERNQAEEVVPEGAVGVIVEVSKRRDGKRRVRFPAFVAPWKVGPELLGLPSEHELEDYEAALCDEEAQEEELAVAVALQLQGQAQVAAGAGGGARARRGVCAVALEGVPLAEINAVYLAVRVDDDSSRRGARATHGDDGKKDEDEDADCDDDAPSEPDAGTRGASNTPASAAEAAAAAVAAAAANAADPAGSEVVFECMETRRRLFRVRDEWMVSSGTGESGGGDVDCAVFAPDGQLPIGGNEWGVRVGGAVNGGWVRVTLQTALLTEVVAVEKALARLEKVREAVVAEAESAARKQLATIRSVQVEGMLAEPEYDGIWAYPLPPVRAWPVHLSGLHLCGVSFIGACPLSPRYRPCCTRVRSITVSICACVCACGCVRVARLLCLC